MATRQAHSDLYRGGDASYKTKRITELVKQLEASNESTSERLKQSLLAEVGTLYHSLSDYLQAIDLLAKSPHHQSRNQRPTG